MRSTRPAAGGSGPARGFEPCPGSGGADRAHIGPDPQPAVGAAADPQPVPLALLQRPLHPVVLPLDGFLVGRVVERRGPGQGLDDGLPGAGQLSRPQHGALLDQELACRRHLVRLEPGQALDPVQHRGEHLDAAMGNRPLADGADRGLRP